MSDTVGWSGAWSTSGIPFSTINRGTRIFDTQCQMRQGRAVRHRKHSTILVLVLGRIDFFRLQSVVSLILIAATNHNSDAIVSQSLMWQDKESTRQLKQHQLLFASASLSRINHVPTVFWEGKKHCSISMLSYETTQYMRLESATDILSLCELSSSPHYALDPLRREKTCTDRWLRMSWKRPGNISRPDSEFVISTRFLYGQRPSILDTPPYTEIFSLPTKSGSLITWPMLWKNLCDLLTACIRMQVY